MNEAHPIEPGTVRNAVEEFRWAVIKASSGLGTQVEEDDARRRLMEEIDRAIERAIEAHRVPDVFTTV
jgi:hypothetical protein